MKRVDATIQARTGSSRLPGKVLRELEGKPLLQHQIERIRQSKRIDRIILATTNRPQDDALAELAIARRGEIVAEVKDNLDHIIEGWGYHLIDLQLNDITFDQAITTSMAQVVASNNLKAAATNEGDALLIRRTKEAEAEGTAIRIAAEAERTAAQLRGQGVALFREEVARGLAQAARQLEDQNVDSALILFSMWTESVRHVAENGKGNVIFLDGSPEGMQQQLRDLMAMQQLNIADRGND